MTHSLQQTSAYLRTFGVQCDGGGSRVVERRDGLANIGNRLSMVLMSAMREVHPSYVHTRYYHLLQHADGAASRTCSTSRTGHSSWDDEVYYRSTVISIRTTRHTHMYCDPDTEYCTYVDQALTLQHHQEIIVLIGIKTNNQLYSALIVARGYNNKLTHDQ